jgi:hypothetical protein
MHRGKLIKHAQNFYVTRVSRSQKIKLGVASILSSSIYHASLVFEKRKKIKRLLIPPLSEVFTCR